MLQPGPKDGNYLARRSTGFLKGDNAPLRQDVVWRRDNIFCPEGMVVITTFYLGIWALSRGETMTVLFLCWLKMLGIRPCKKLVFSRARAFGLKGSRAEQSPRALTQYDFIYPCQKVSHEMIGILPTHTECRKPWLVPSSYNGMKCPNSSSYWRP